MTPTPKELAFIKSLCERELKMIGGDRDTARELLEKINDELRGETHLHTIAVKWSAYDVA